MKKLFGFAFIAIIALFMTACEQQRQLPSADSIQRQQQEQLSQQSNASVGMPAIINFQEKRILKDIYERRDKAIVTITYTQDMNGNLHKLCDSIGYGIPASTQFTNPQKIDWRCSTGNGGCASGTIPQADPNGLYSPASSEGTWIMCKDPAGTKVEPVYSEPRIIVSTFALR
jgi:hypothetical protein